MNPESMHVQVPVCCCVQIYYLCEFVSVCARACPSPGIGLDDDDPSNLFPTFTAPDVRMPRCVVLGPLSLLPSHFRDLLCFIHPFCALRGTMAKGAAAVRVLLLSAPLCRFVKLCVARFPFMYYNYIYTWF